MHQAVIHIDPKGPASIGLAQAAGMPGDIRFDFKTQGNLAYPGIADLYPQLVMRPFTRYGVKLYDITINDPVGASGIALVPGVEMNDTYHLEVYSRLANGQPQRMLAQGRATLNGYAYVSSGPLGPASYPEGPAGVQGPQGAVGDTGMRGSRWYTGVGPPEGPIPDDRVPGDMWLDESNGDVWRWDGVMWRAFKGA